MNLLRVVGMGKLLVEWLWVAAVAAWGKLCIGFVAGGRVEYNCL